MQLCSICMRRKNISEKRIIAKRKQEHQADKILERSRKRFKPAESGENVNVPVPDVDRGKLDPPHFTAVVKSFNPETGLYDLGTRFGSLEQRFSRNQFDLISERFLSISDIPDRCVGVKEAARLHSMNGGQGFFKCRQNARQKDADV